MALTAAINFRATSGYVTDGTGETYSLGEIYPVTRGGYTFGWSVDLTGSSRDRASGNDARLAGLVFTNNTAHYFRIDLPATGTYDVRVAAGDAAATGNGALWDLNDTTTVLASLTKDSLTAQHFIDATDVDLINTSWPGSNTKITGVFATTQFRLKCRAVPVANNVIAHIRIDSVDTYTDDMRPRIQEVVPWRRKPRIVAYDTVGHIQAGAA